MAGIDPQLYEAAVIDGASRWRQVWHITLTGIRSTVITLLILRLSHIFDTGFEQILLMQNALVRDAALVFDTYAYTIGIREGRVSIGIAVGLFKSIVGLLFVIGANNISKKSGFDGIY
jgi:putative aldouronate transport system permease protein